MTLYQRITFAPGERHDAFELVPGELILTNLFTGEHSVVSREEFEREFREVEG